jgi:uncharacterized membrane protein YhaH (DUF805 family)
VTNPIVSGLTGLGRFSGRDSLGRFRPYAASVVAAGFIIGGAGLAWAMQGVFAEMQAFASAHPEAATVATSPGSYSIAIDATHPDAPSPDFAGFFTVLALMVGFVVILLAAAVSRRLHDSGLPAYLGLIPLVFLTVGICLFPIMMADFENSAEPNMGLFAALFLNNILYLVALGTLIILLARRSVEGPNRYGPQPD